MSLSEMHVEIDPGSTGRWSYYLFLPPVDHLNRLLWIMLMISPIHFIRRGNTDLTYTHADNLITIDLGKSLLLDEQDTIVISFSRTGFDRKWQEHLSSAQIWILDHFGIRAKRSHRQD
jgi:hypothetical protein